MKKIPERIIKTEPVFVDISTIPKGGRDSPWRDCLYQLREKQGKASVLKYNNRQRAFQVATAIRTSARYWGYRVAIRVRRAEPAIDNDNGWLVYFWVTSSPEELQ